MDKDKKKKIIDDFAKEVKKYEKLLEDDSEDIEPPINQVTRYLIFGVFFAQKHLLKQKLDDITSLPCFEITLGNQYIEDPELLEDDSISDKLLYMLENGTYQVATTLLDIRFPGKNWKNIVNRFFQDIVRFHVTFFCVKDEKDVWITLRRIYDYNALFFKDDEAGEWDTVCSQKYSIWQFPSVSFLINENINFFGDIGGFEMILLRIKSERQPKPSILYLNSIVAFLKTLNVHLREEFCFEYHPKLFKAISELILGYTSQELKDLATRKDFQKLIAHLSALTGLANAGKEIEEFCLNYILKCMHSESLEKRLNAYMDINELIERAELRDVATVDIKQKLAPTKYLTLMTILNWLDSNKIIDCIFNVNNFHEESIKRAGPILALFARGKRLEEKHLDMLWDCAAEKQETTVEIIYRVIQEVARIGLSSDRIEYLLDKFRKISPGLFTRIQLDLLHHLCSCAIFQLRNYEHEAHSKKERVGGLDILWDLSKSKKCRYSEDALECLVQQLNHSPLSVHNNYLRTGVDELLNHTEFVPGALRIIQEILINYKDQIPDIEAKFKLVDTVFEDLIQFKEKASELFHNQRQTVDTWFPAQQFHQARTRLGFLNFLLDQTKHTLSMKRTIQLWKALVTQSLLPEEQQAALQWFASYAEYEYFFENPTETFSFLLNEEMPKMGFKALSSDGFECWKRLFVASNKGLGTILQFDDSWDFVILKWKGLIGIESLWEIVTQSEDPDVIPASLSFLVSLLSQLSPELQENRLDLHRYFLDKVAEFLSLAAKQNSNFLTNRLFDLLDQLLYYENSSLKRYRKGTLIKLKFQSSKFDPFELETHSNATLGDIARKVTELTAWPAVRFIFAGKILKGYDQHLEEFRIKDGCTLNFTEDKLGPPPPPPDLSDSSVNIEELEKTYPSFILTHNAQYYNQLFDILDSIHGAPQLEEKILDFINNLPDIPDIKEKIVKMSQKPNWEQLLKSDSPYRLLYSLKIVHNSVLSVANFQDHFTHSGGVLALYNILQSNTPVLKNEACLAHLLMVLSLVTLTAPSVPAIVENSNFDIPTNTLAQINPTTTQGFDFQFLINQLFQVTLNSLQDPLKANPDLIDSALALALAGSVDHVNILLTSDIFIELVQTALFKVPDRILRETVANHLSALATSGSMFAKTTETLPHVFLLDLLVGKFISQVQPQAQNTEHYFLLLNTLLPLSQRERPFEFWQNLFVSLAQQLKTYPIIEADDSDYDVVVTGIVKTLDHLVQLHSQLKSIIKQMKLIPKLFELLFQFPTGREQGSLQPPVCKSEYSREAVFSFLKSIISEEPKFQKQTIKLIKKHQLDNPCPEGELPWDYTPAHQQRAETGYVGLKNLGCTCYMNSLIQQLFMIPQFRRGILAFDCQNQDPKESTMYQLQATFSYLQEYQKQFYNPEAFCLTNKDYEGQTVDLYQQMDVDEYFNMLCDTLERSMEGSYQKRLPKNIWGGCMATQLICKGCPHKYEKDDDFAILPLEINHKNTLEEALEGFITSELLENDNAYNCDRCGCKRDVIKRSCLKHLPNTLMISLKRFTFNYDLMRKVKLDSYCEFPSLLNVKKYTTVGVDEQDAQQEGFQKSEVEELNEDDKIRIRALEEAKQRPDAYYQYKLVGVIVHRGNTEFGHYYSFIKERIPKKGSDELRWLEFNDKEVTLFDPENLPDECFGGEEQVEKWDNITRTNQTEIISKNRSAYVLIYEREQAFPPVGSLFSSVSSDPNRNEPAQPVTKKTYNSESNHKPFNPKPALLAALFIAKLKVRVKQNKNRQTWGTPVPAHFFNQIWKQNTIFYKQKAVLSDDFHQLICLLLKEHHILPSNTTGLERSNHNDKSSRMIDFAVSFYFENITKSGSRSCLRQTLQCLQNYFLQHHPSLGWFIDKICKGDELNDYLNRCPILEIRSTFTDLLLFLVKSLMAHEKHALIEDSILEEDSDDDSMEEVDRPNQFATRTGFLMNTIVVQCLYYKDWFLRYFDQTYRFLTEFAKLGDSALKYMIKNDILGHLIRHWVHEESNGKKISKMKRSKKLPPIADSKYALDFFHLLICSAHTRNRFILSNTIPEDEDTENEEDEEFIGTVRAPPTLLKTCNSILHLPTQTNSKGEISYPILQKNFLKKLITCGANPQATNNILNHWAWKDDQVLTHFFSTICAAYSSSDYDMLDPIFEAFEGLLLFETAESVDRIQMGLEMFLKEVEARKKAPKKTGNAVNFLKTLQEKNDIVAEYFTTNWEVLSWLWTYN